MNLNFCLKNHQKKQLFINIIDIYLYQYGGISLSRKKRILKFEDIMKIERISNPAVHPSGKYVAYVITKHDHIENTIKSTIMISYINTLVKRELTPGESSDTEPEWSPDGKFLAFISDRKDGKQIWILPFEESGEAVQLTNGMGGASNPVWSLDGTRIAFSRNVVVSKYWDSKIDKEVDKENQIIESSKIYGLINKKSNARLEDSLLYRHWDTWREKKRSHLFMVELKTGKMVDLTPFDADIPPISLGGIKDFEFSPDGTEIAYVKNPDKIVTLSTNNSIFLQKINRMKKIGKAKMISTTKAMDLEPRYSPNGRFIAYLGGEKPLYESDKLRIKIYDKKTEKTRVLTENFDRSANNPVWSEDCLNIYFLAADFGYMNIYSVNIDNLKIKQYTKDTYNSNLRLFPKNKLLITRESVTNPADIYIFKPKNGFNPIIKYDTKKKLIENILKITNFGDWLKKEIKLNKIDEFCYKGADSDMNHGFLLKPPGFNSKLKYSTILLIHGGPQSAFFNHFHYRWNPQLFASEGYVVIMLNPRGSVGYGQKFTDQISGDWGGRCFEDIFKGLDYCLKKYPFIDKNKLAAAGASFGGFMINWIAGHSHKFKALVSHDGIFNAESMAYMTEELWFEIWEHGGMPHEKHEDFLKYSPHLHVQNYKTPMLVIQGEQDFRCPVSEGISLFTALQYMKIPSKFLYFPDEGHWVLKPANSHVWYRTVLDFINKYTN